MQAGLVVETGDAREVHHFALLLGYGANAINPYLAYESLLGLGLDPKKALSNYIKAVDKGLLKIFSKMGISTLQSYCGAQIFEALGLSSEIVDMYFAGTTTRIGGVDLATLETEILMRHHAAFPEREIGPLLMPVGGWYQYRQGGEYHLWNPETIIALQQAVRNEDYKKFKTFTAMVDHQALHLTTLRSLLKFKKSQPISIDEVEPAQEIVKRFVTGAMSFGSISKEAHEAMAIAMNRLGA
jgi:glutamate synthase (NADPH) large chain